MENGSSPTPTSAGPAVVHPSGDLDAVAAGELRSEFGQLIDGRDVLVDLSDVSFMDSAGLGALIGGVRRIREAGGRVVCCCPTDTVARLLHTTGFDRVAPVVGTPAEAEALLAADDDA